MNRPDFVIIGGGCYGSYYVRQLLQARDRGKLDWRQLLVLDRDADCAVAEKFGGRDVVVEQCEWESWGDRLFDGSEGWGDCQLVPAPIAPHVVKHWLVTALEAAGANVEGDRWTGEVPTLPYADTTDAGQLVLSHAPGLCPTNCIEPRMCPLTGGERTWDMPDTVREAASGLDDVVVLECRHFAYGVGTIPMRAILDAFERLVNRRRPADVGVATSSGCHALVDRLRLS